MTTPRLLVLSDFQNYPQTLTRAQMVCQAAAAGSVAVVLRDRQASVRERLEWGRVLREMTHRRGQQFHVSDRLDLARLLRADGLHLPADGFAPSRVVDQIPWVSRACHDADALADGELRALSAMLVSPCFAERKGRPALGLDGLRVQAARLRARAPRLLVYALGGVDAQYARQALAAGADGVAVISAVLDPRSDIPSLLSALGIQR